jgi:hypothetical protein
MLTLEPYRTFRSHGAVAREALDLVRAEEHSRRMNWRVEWTEDTETVPVCWACELVTAHMQASRCAMCPPSGWEDCVGEHHTHTLWRAILRDRTGAALAIRNGIEATDTPVRQIEATLAIVAMHNERNAA